ncbi:MAG: bifunctional hydroxymethylpyrimidine kinase/phosphomethylpyrimidine kinase [Pontiellaceae bacterium]|nr:bifunctional hydroxymethylpyrimidine kinase/phosphomethylpyrimidine kinase [Pontiellaceae bacterium]
MKINSACAWTIAGSDPSGGAGIQVDLKVMNAFGVHGCSVITALTAQNTLGVQSVEPVSQTMLLAQLNALAADLPPAAVKTGMLGSAATCRNLAAFIPAALPHTPIVCDPILKSTSGADLLNPAALETFKRELLPLVTVLTPNLPETESILGAPITSVEDAAKQILDLGVQSVLIKGGHAAQTDCRDYWTDGTSALWLTSPRIQTSATHGTGCILSSAIAAALALGNKLSDAVIQAKTFLNQCLRSPAGVGQGHGPMRILPFENVETDRPAID